MWCRMHSDIYNQRCNFHIQRQNNTTRVEKSPKQIVVFPSSVKDYDEQVDEDENNLVNNFYEG